MWFSFGAAAGYNTSALAETWTTLKVIDWTTGRFDRAGLESPRLEAQLLLAHILKCDRVALYTQFDRPLAADELAAYRTLIQRRLDGECVAYLVGTKEFWSREFLVNKDVLVPRADTETVISAVLDRLSDSPGGPIIDVGTGSGAIAVTLACEIPDRRVVAVDISQDALAVAARNAERHQAADRIDFRLGDLLAPAAKEQFSFVVANLPYVEADEIEKLAAEVRSEPRLALDGGSDGLDLIRLLIGESPARLLAGGWLVLEHGEDQGEAVRKLLTPDAGFDQAETIEDLAGRDRVTLARRTAA